MAGLQKIEGTRFTTGEGKSDHAPGNDQHTKGKSYKSIQGQALGSLRDYGDTGPSNASLASGIGSADTRVEHGKEKVPGINEKGQRGRFSPQTGNATAIGGPQHSRVKSATDSLPGAHPSKAINYIPGSAGAGPGLSGPITGGKSSAPYGAGGGLGKLPYAKGKQVGSGNTAGKLNR